MRTPTVAALLAAFALQTVAPQGTAAAQTPLGVSVRASIDSVSDLVRRLGRADGEAVWPGFRPDTIPVVFVFPGRGKLLVNWPGALPTGYTHGPGETAWQSDSALTAASTSTSIDGRATAQVVVADDATGAPSIKGAELTALTFHEAFHVLQGAERSDDRRFGRGENSYYVASYPIFDEENESLFTLEGKLLASALDARTAAQRRTAAREFVAVRRRRQARLMPEFVAFDDASEMNEGLAQYAQLRALGFVRDQGPMSWRADASHALLAERQRLDSLTADVSRSFRLRYYSTGPAMALLLDRLVGAGWKSAMVEQNRTLSEMLARASGIDDAAERAASRALAVADEGRLRRATTARIAALQARRQREADSVLALPGLRVVLALDSAGPDWGLCGFDPQNHLQVTSTVQLQTRWWRPCAGSASADLGVPSVHDATARTVSAVVGAQSAVTLTAGGQPLSVADGQTLRGVEKFRLSSPRVTIEAGRADVSREGRTLTVHVLR